MQANKKGKIFFSIVFVCYVVVIFMVVVLKVNHEALSITRDCIKMNRASGFWNYNIIPFKTIRTYMNLGSSVGIENLVGNIIPFLPVGFLLRFIFDKSCMKKTFWVSLFIVIIFESIQFFACIGFFDIDDIILNVLSSVLGCVICAPITKRVKIIMNNFEIQ